jgi:hypothetical protein
VYAENGRENLPAHGKKIFPQKGTSYGLFVQLYPPIFKVYVVAKKPDGGPILTEKMPVN